MQFLLANNFSIDHMCSFGVPYLSREEEKQAVKRALERCQSRVPVHCLEIKKDDKESLDFVASVRNLVDEWLAQGEV